VSKQRYTTIALVLGTILAWFALELAYIFTGQPTISEEIQTFALSFPFIGVMVGAVVGGLLVHFFWLSRSK
jgi:hypothetical protein